MDEAGMIRALLLDLDGVVRVWSPENDRRAEQATGLPAGALRGAAFAPELLDGAVTGRVADEDWRRQIVERLRADFPASDAERAVRLWSASPGAVDRRVIELVRACRRTVPVVLITNATSRLDRDLERLRLAAEFDHVVNSAVVGAMKPDRAIFQHALRVVDVAGADALYVDDTARHVAAASQLGIIGHVFRDADRLRAELMRHRLWP